MPELRPCIFLIDDDKDDLEILSSSLEPYGIRIRAFRSGILAMSHFENMSVFAERPSLIIVDYNMPLLNGLETLILIKNNERVRHIPVVVYSTTINPLFERNAREFGAFACESKALNVNDFREQVGRFADLAYSFSRKISVPDLNNN
jgi:CheY-like chemotaxis protein